MELEQARKRAEELRVIIEKNNRLYYDQDAPELEDFEYDAMTRELKAIEKEYPELVTANSPTQHVGGTASSKFSKVTHAVKMESLQDAFSFDELREFDARVREAGVKPEYVVEAKIDGLSVSLEYRMGQLVRGSTRGDGVVGEDVTENIATIKDLVRKELGVSILPRSACMDELSKGKLAALPIENLSMVRETRIAYNGDFSHMDIMQEIIREYRETARMYR